jgi:tetratricopeptide (TPR) repeat protein
MRIRPLAFAAIAGVAVLVAAVSVTLSGRVLGSSFAIDPVEDAVAKQSPNLKTNPSTLQTTPEKALRVRGAIKAGDYATARQITDDVLAHSRLLSWRFYPFEDFIEQVSDAGDADLEAHLNAWIAQRGSGAAPLLIRAQYYHDTGWLVRGSGFADKVKGSRMAAFVNYMTKGLSDVDEAIAADDANPYGFYLKLLILRGHAGLDAVRQAFAQGIARHPSYYRLYAIMLNALEPRWYGSVPAMYAFVAQHAGSAPQDSPLKLLYLSLYHRIVMAAANSCSSEKENAEACFAYQMQKTVAPQLQSRVLEALQLFDHADKYEFGLAIKFALFNMLRTRMAAAYSGTILELSAQVMHSDTRLKEERVGPNNYLIDMAVAESWTAKGFYENAISKYNDALKDIEATQFPGEAEKVLAVADVYAALPTIYQKLGKYPDMIAYDNAVVALGGKANHLPFACHGYYKLRNYAAAIRSCSANIGRDAGSIEAYYWRGMARRDLGEPDAALRDLTVVAEAEHGFRASAVIAMSMIHFDRHDNRGALAVLNRYSYLYDPEQTSKSDAAVGYNNRCYAYMELGELKKALADCNESLKYGSIPDAIRKKLELMKRLASEPS